MRCTTMVVLAAMLSTSAAGAQDVCAGAIASKPMARRMDATPSGAVAGKAAAGAAIGNGPIGVARGVNMYPGSGAGPIPDVTDWKPRGKIPMGTELIIQGRNLVPGQFVALLGGFPLTPTAQSPSEFRFKVTDAADASPLIVYNTNGQPRTLESAFVVYDPTPYITRVVPSTFGQGDLVTICGTSLYDAFFADVFSPLPVTGVPNISQVQQVMGKFVRIGQNWLEMDNPVVSPTGDRITFRAGGVDTTARACNGRASCSTSAGITDFAAAFPTPPTSVSGALTVRLSGVNRWVLGPTLTWTPPVSRITSAYGKFVDAHVPWVLLPSAGTGASINGRVYVDGMNLGFASFTVSGMRVNERSYIPGQDNVSINLGVPLNASNGPVCTTSGRPSCSAPLTFFGGPVISRLPAMPLTVKTTYTIEGINLLPPAAAVGLKYRLIEWLDRLDSSSEATNCNMRLQVIEHTANKIVFRIGDPAVTTPMPPSCASSPFFQQNPVQKLTLRASMTGVNQQFSLDNGMPFYLKP